MGKAQETAKAAAAAMNEATNALVGLKGLLQVPGAELHVHVYPQDHVTKSRKMAFRGRVDTGLFFQGQRVVRIRGSLKEFTSGNMRLDFTNSNDSQYPNSEWDSMLHDNAEGGLTREAVIVITKELKKRGGDNKMVGWHKKVTVDKDGNWVWNKLERTVIDRATTEAENAMIGDLAEAIDVAESTRGKLFDAPKSEEDAKEGEAGKSPFSDVE